MKYLDEMMGLIEHEFGEITKNGKFRSPEQVHMAYELLDMVKDIECIWDYEESSGEYSGYPTYPRGKMSYEDDMSYARGRGAKRNSMGQYSRNDRPYYYSMTDAAGDFVKDLNKIMYDTSDEETRNELQSLIQHIKR